MKELLLILLAGVLVNNYAFQSFLGISPVLSAKNAAKSAGMGLAVTVVMVFATLVTWPLQTYVLAAFGLGYLQTMVFVLIILVLAGLAGAVVKMIAKKPLGICFPLLVLNSAVLGVTVNNINAGYTFVQSIMSALGAGLGFLLAMVLFAGVRSKISETHVPKVFRGLPISLLAAAIISMALLAF